MNFESKYIKNIISANNDNSLAIFVGAGISKSSEKESFKLPSWSDLIIDLKKELNDSNENDYLKIAQLYYLAFGEFTYYKKLKEYFPDFIASSELHKLIFEINPHIILTTNWDNILERTIEDNAFIFDTICSDRDLVKSSLQNKLVKMHGDFKNHNIVFKEDDYINYQFNFPLIENFVKSILSTHTILFIGYSYNDINLKQILNWIKNHSDVRPPMYLTIFENNTTQIKYLENHGITSIILKNIDSTAIGVDPYSKKMYSFLMRIKNKDEFNILNSDNEIVEFVLKKIEPLNDLNGILIEQVQKSLSNCGFVFDNDSKPILEFYDTILTGALDKNKRAIYKQFVEILKSIDAGNIPSSNLIKIFEILDKARIKGIVISSEDLSRNSEEYLPFSAYLNGNTKDSSNTYLDFDFKELIKNSTGVGKLFELAFKQYNLMCYEEAFGLLEEAVSHCLKQRNYTLLFIAMFNRNILLKKLKYGTGFNWKKYAEIEEYNLKDRYYNLTKDLRLALEPIYEFIDFSFIYRYAYNVAEELKKTENSKRTIEAGGFVLNSNIFKFSSKHENLLNFIFRNKIMIENSNEFKKINKSFVEIAIIRQIQEKDISLNKIELFTCIKYIDYEDLKLMLDDYYNDESTKKCKFQISDENKEWLLKTVIPNIVNQYLESKRPFNQCKNYIENSLFLLSLSKQSKNNINDILGVINRIVSEGNNTIGIFQSINLFLGVQYNLYNLEIEEPILLELIENLINKIVYKKFNRHEYIALTRNELSNVYGYARGKKAVLKNLGLINKLLNEIDTFKVSDKIEICQNFVLNLYEISDTKIKDKIKSYILKINSSEEKELYKKIIFDLTLLIYDFKSLEKENIKELNDYLEQFKVGTSFSSVLYMIDSQIDYLRKDKKISGLDDISKTIKEAIERYKASDRMSIF